MRAWNTLIAVLVAGMLLAALTLFFGRDESRRIALADGSILSVTLTTGTNHTFATGPLAQWRFLGGLPRPIGWCFGRPGYSVVRRDTDRAIAWLTRQEPATGKYQPVGYVTGVLIGLDGRTYEMSCYGNRWDSAIDVRVLEWENYPRRDQTLTLRLYPGWNNTNAVELPFRNGRL